MKQAFFLTLTIQALTAAESVLTLRAAMERTIRLNPEIQLARLKHLEAQAVAASTASAYKPQMTAVIGQSYRTNNIQGVGLSFPQFPGRLGPYRLFDARPVLTQTVLDMSLLSGIRAARQRIEQKKFEAQAVQQELLFVVAQLYLHTLEAASQTAAIEARVQSSEAILKQSRDLEQGGAASKLDVARAEQQYQRNIAEKIESQRNTEVTRSLLAKAIGIDDSLEFAMQPIDSASGTDTEITTNQALQARADYNALEAKHRVATQELQKAQRDRLPKITIGGDYGLLGQGIDRSLSTYSAGAAVTIPLFTSGCLKQDAEAAHLRLAIVEQEQRQAKVRILQEVRQAQTEIIAARQALTAAEKSVTAAHEALGLAGLRLTSGLATNVEVVQAQELLAQSDRHPPSLRTPHRPGKGMLRQRRYPPIHGILLSLGTHENVRA